MIEETDDDKGTVKLAPRVPKRIVLTRTRRLRVYRKSEFRRRVIDVMVPQVTEETFEGVEIMPQGARAGIAQCLFCFGDDSHPARCASFTSL